VPEEIEKERDIYDQIEIQGVRQIKNVFEEEKNMHAMVVNGNKDDFYFRARLLSLKGKF
jgi:hypothetical protein